MLKKKVVNGTVLNLVKQVCAWEGESEVEVSGEVTQLFLLETDVSTKKYLLPPVCR